MKDFKTLLEHIDSRVTLKMLAATGMRVSAGLLDVASLGLIWFTADAVATGTYREISIAGVLRIPESSIDEISVAGFGLVVLLLFALKSALSLVALRWMVSLAVEAEVSIARDVLTNYFDSRVGGSWEAKKQLPVVQSAILSARSWVQGSLVSLSTLVAEGLLAAGLIFVMLIANPISTIFLIAIFGVAFFLLQRIISRKLTVAARQQRRNTVLWLAELSGMMSVATHLQIKDKAEEWIAGISSKVRLASTGAGKTTFINSLPRHVLELSSLISVSVVLGISFLIGDFAQNLAGAAVILAGAFRLSGALLPIQSSLNQAVTGSELGNAVKEGLRDLTTRDFEINPRHDLRPYVDDLIESDSQKFLIVTGRSGIGKSTALMALLQDLLTRTPEGLRLGYGGQDGSVIPGGFQRNLALDYAPSDKTGLASGELSTYIKGLGAEKLMRRLGTDTKLGATSEVLSGGEITRLEILRAHTNRPHLILLDEPTTGLDSKTSDALASLLMNSHAKYVIVSHDDTFASRLRPKVQIEFD